MRTIRFQHADRGRTVSYRVSFYLPGQPSPEHSFETNQVMTQAVTTPPTYEIPSSVVQANQPPAGTYEIVVTAINAQSSASSDRSAPTSTEPPLVAPTNISVTY